MYFSSISAGGTATTDCVSLLSEGFPNVDISWTQIVNIYNYGEENAD